MKNYFQNKNSGFTLIEMMVAIVIFTLSLLSMIIILGGGIADTNLAKQKLISSYLAQEGVEHVRNLRDSYALYEGPTGWGSFIAAMGPCGASQSGKGCYINVDNVVSDIVDEVEITSCFEGNCQPLLFNESSGKYGYNSGTESGFTRLIFMDSIDDASQNREVKIYSMVYWEQNGKIQQTIFTESLLNWIRPI